MQASTWMTMADNTRAGVVLLKLRPKLNGEEHVRIFGGNKLWLDFQIQDTVHNISESQNQPTILGCIRHRYFARDGKLCVIAFSLIVYITLDILFSISQT